MQQYFQPNFQICGDFDTPVAWQMLTNIWQDSLHLAVKVMQISLTRCVSYQCLTWSSYPKQSHLPHFPPKLLQRRKHKLSPQRNAIACTRGKISVLSGNNKSMDQVWGSAVLCHSFLYSTNRRQKWPKSATNLRKKKKKQDRKKNRSTVPACSQ